MYYDFLIKTVKEHVIIIYLLIFYLRFSGFLTNIRHTICEVSKHFIIPRLWVIVTAIYRNILRADRLFGTYQ